MFAITLSSGPFLVAPNAQSVDWVLINDSAAPQPFRVSVYKWGVGVAKVLLGPGAITDTLPAGMAFHNANSVPSLFVPGFYYEVVVETNSPHVLPNVNQWSSHGGTDFIPGTLIPAAAFVKRAEHP